MIMFSSTHSTIRHFLCRTNMLFAVLNYNIWVETKRPALSEQMSPDCVIRYLISKSVPYVYNSLPRAWNIWQIISVDHTWRRIYLNFDIITNQNGLDLVKVMLENHLLSDCLFYVLRLIEKRFLRLFIQYIIVRRPWVNLCSVIEETIFL